MRVSPSHHHAPPVSQNPDRAAVQARRATQAARPAGTAVGPGSNQTGYGTVVVTSVLADLDVPFVTFDQFGRLVDVSPAAERVAGATVARQVAVACQSVALLAVSERAGTNRPHGRVGADRWIADVLGWSVVVRALPAGDTARVAVGVITPSESQRFSGAAPLAVLTPREREVAQLLAGGASAKAIAYALGRSIHTVRRHTDRIFAKVGVGSRTQLANALRR